MVEILGQILNPCGFWMDTSVHGFVGAIVGWALLYAAILGLAGLAARILFGLAAYNDAMSKNNQEAVMWGLLIGFLGLIPGIIYLCIRNSQQRSVCCPKCGYWHRPFDPVCPRCGQPTQPMQQPMNPYMQVYASKAKKQLIAALICLGSVIVIAIVGGIALGTFAAMNAIPYDINF